MIKHNEDLECNPLSPNKTSNLRVIQQQVGSKKSSSSVWEVCRVVDLSLSCSNLFQEINVTLDKDNWTKARRYANCKNIRQFCVGFFVLKLSWHQGCRNPIESSWSKQHPLHMEEGDIVDSDQHTLAKAMLNQLCNTGKNIPSTSK